MKNERTRIIAGCGGRLGQYRGKGELRMTLEDKRTFINDLVTSVQGDLIRAVERAPGTWDGHELRQWIADQFAYQAKTLSGSRLKDYKNEVLVRNL